MCPLLVLCTVILYTTRSPRDDISFRHTDVLLSVQRIVLFTANARRDISGLAAAFIFSAQVFTA